MCFASKNISLVILNVFLVIFLALTFAFNVSVHIENLYAAQALSFLKGRLDLPQGAPGEDLFSYKAKIYWYHEPLPAIVLVPFVYIFEQLSFSFYQGYLQFLITVGVFILALKLARKRFSKEDSLYLAFAFCFASVYQAVAVIPLSWYFAQTIATLLTLFALLEYSNKKRILLIGLSEALVVLARPLAGVGILFFIFEILTDKKYVFRRKFVSFLELISFPVLSVLILLWYSVARFGSLIDFGLVQRVPEATFGFIYIPVHFYLYFLRLLTLPHFSVTPPGTSFFVVSPIFLNIFRAKIENKYYQHLLIVIIIMLGLLLAYRWHGWVQVGPRYLIDLLPFLYIFLLQSFNKLGLSLFIKIVILLSSVFDFYLFLTVFL